MAYTYAGQFGPEAVISNTGAPVPDASVTVYNADGTTPSTLYTDRTKGSTAGNPVLTDGSGNLEFWAEPGQHVLKFTAPGVSRTIAITVPSDPAEDVTGAAKGQPNGVASLDGTGAVPSAQLANLIGTYIPYTGTPQADLTAFGRYLPEAHGAVGNGTTDDTTAVQAAINAAPAGGVVYLSKLFAVAAVKPKSGVTITGPGAVTGAGLKLKNSAGGVGIIDGSSVGSYTDVVIENLLLDGNNANNATTGNAIQCATACARWTIRNNRIINPPGQGIGVHDLSDSLIEGNSIESSGRQKVGTNDGTQAGIALTNSSRNRVIGNRVDNPNDAGIITISGCTGTVIEGNTIRAAFTIGIALGSAGSKYTVTGNYVTGCTDNGIDCGNNTSGTVSGNTVDTCLSGIAVDFSSTAGTPLAGVAITGNTVASCTQMGVYLAGPAGGATGFTVSGNTITSPTQSGIQVTGIAHSAISGNTVYQPGGTYAAVHIDGACTYLTVTGNHGYDLRGPATSYGVGFGGGYTGGNNTFADNDFRLTLGVSGTAAATDVFTGVYTGKIHAATPGSAASNVVTTVPLDTFDTNASGFSVATSAVSVPVPGRYLVSFYMDVANAATGNQRDVWVEVAGTRYAESLITAQSPSPWRVTGTDVITFAAGNTATVKIYQDASTAMAINACHLSLVKIA